MSVIVNLDPRDIETPYFLFSLKTRMRTDIAEIFGQDITVVFLRDIEYNRFKVELVNGTVSQKTTQKNIDNLKKIVDHWMEVRPEVCLLLDPFQRRFKLDGIPSSWIRDMIPIINVRSHRTLINDNKLYVELEPESDYIKIHTDMVLGMLNSLRQRYDEGYVYGYGKIAEQWKLEDLGSEFYRATWKDTRFAPNIVSFLTDKFLESFSTSESKISVRLGSSNKVSRHFISKKLKQIPKFINDRVIVTVVNLQDAIALSDEIVEASLDACGTVNISVHREEPDVESDNQVFYMTGDVQYPYVLSSLHTF